MDLDAVDLGKGVVGSGDDVIQAQGRVSEVGVEDVDPLIFGLAGNLGGVAKLGHIRLGRSWRRLRLPSGGRVGLRLGHFGYRLPDGRRASRFKRILGTAGGH